MYRAHVFVPRGEIANQSVAHEPDALAIMARGSICTSEVGGEPICPRRLAACAMRVMALDTQDGIDLTAECANDCERPVGAVLGLCVKTLRESVRVRTFTGPDALDQYEQYMKSLEPRDR